MGETGIKTPKVVTLHKTKSGILSTLGSRTISVKFDDQGIKIKTEKDGEIKKDNEATKDDIEKNVEIKETDDEIEIIDAATVTQKDATPQEAMKQEINQ